ncbi:MAG: hypothetical protein JWM18_4687 [Chloroflexi bacterium]|nr:hypothetical protein [Chloroflexota bacterium]
MTPARRCALALALLGIGLLALVLSPAGRPSSVPAVAARAAVARTEVVAEKTSRTHTSHSRSTSTDRFACPSRLIEIFPIDCGQPTDTPRPGPTFSFTNSAGQVSIPPTATPRPAPTATPTPLDTPFPSDLPGGDPGTAAVTSTSGSAALPASGGGGSGRGMGVPLVAGLVILVLLGGSAGMAVLRLR